MFCTNFVVLQKNGGNRMKVRFLRRIYIIYFARTENQEKY